MTLATPQPWWLTAALAALMLGDAALSVRPPAFIRNCLDGVHFPRDWWWVLIAVKSLAGIGLIAGLRYPGVGAAANAGVVAYFLCAAYAHYRADFLKREFWLNCLGMLAFATVVAVISYGR